jgi:YebC/PmpR family DNA-binding regulatory protein
MPKDNVERAIKKGTGELDGVDYTELTYEAYAPGGVALLIDILSGIEIWSAAEVRHILSKGGGNLGESGCVAYMFKRKGNIVFDAQKYSEDEIMEAALEAGAEDVSSDDEIIEVVTAPDNFEDVLKTLEDANFQNEAAEIAMVADTTITLDNEKTGKVLRLIENLEDNDDVQNVYSNLNIPDDYDPGE